MRKRALWLACALAVSLFAALAAPALQAGSETINYADINKIKAEGLSTQRSQVMELCSWLSDVYTPRVTGSPAAMKAAEWAVAKMKEWGLQNVAIEPWVNKNGFERGWTNDKFYLQVTAPERFPVPGTPTAWTPGTNGLVSGEAVLVTAATEEELAAFKGKLKGKWVMLVAAPDVAAFWEPRAKRYKADELAALELNPAPAPLEFGVTPPGQRGGAPAAQQPAAGQRAGAPAAAQGQRGGAPAAGAPGQPPRNFATTRSDFLKAEGALGTITTTAIGHGIYTIGGNRAADPATTLPAISIAAEQYGRIARTLAKKIPVTIEADIKSTFYPNPAVFNVVGEITGTDKADEVVLLGAHIDTWHAATGAADDGVGVAAMMEALRILKASGVTLRRTVRVGLWEGEEQGLIGSREYVSAHYATQEQPPAAPGAPPAAAGGQRGFGGPQGPIVTKPAFDKFCVYFNIDNGTGALRGVYLQGNDAVAPIFREWMEPFRSLGMTTLTPRNTGGTDHQSFDRVGLPGFQFIQDDVEYNGVTHHTNMDTYERLQPNDVMRMSTIVAGWAYLAANRDEKLPRKPPVPPGQGGGRRGQ
jgi:carboxypeptidase Q